MTGSKRSPLVSVIIPHWNGYSILKECLDSLSSCNYDNLEVVIVDNNSTDGSQKNIKNDFPDFELFENSKNEGYAGGCNRGAELAKGEYLVFLNNDTIHNENWIEILVNELEKDSYTVAAQPKILNYFNRENFDYAGGAGGKIDIFGFPLAKGRVLTHIEKDANQYDEIDDIFWSSGTAFMIKRDAFFNVGKFDESFFAHMEEVDLCWKLHLSGLNVISVPKAVIYHRNAATLTMYSHIKYYLNHRNSLMMVLTNYSPITAAYIYPLRLGLEILALLYSIVKFDKAHFTAIIRSQLYMLIHPHLVIKRWLHIKKLRKVRDRDIMKKMVRHPIVIDFYLRSKKTWKEIRG